LCSKHVCFFLFSVSEKEEGADGGMKKRMHQVRVGQLNRNQIVREEEGVNGERNMIFQKKKRMSQILACLEN
jgi:hypothetical protein